ncbi:MAG: DUF3500 domain-containing protein [Planctomycetota bacterium]
MFRRSWLLAMVMSVVTVAVTFQALSQPPGRGQRRGQRGGGEASLAEPFRGISAGGKIEEGLFEIESTGVSTLPVVNAATKFLAALNDDQKQRAMYPVDHIEWRSWDNRHFYKRRGVGFDEMDEQQRELAFSLMKESLSAKGLRLSKDIMKLNGTLAELTKNDDEYGEWLYWITVMGEPSETEPWGWQIDGHHLIVNYFVIGDQVVMSPVFVGSEPVHAKAGKFKGTIVMQDEQDKGLALMLLLNDQQRSEATLSTTKPANNAVAQAYRDNLNLDFAGIPASNLDEMQKKRLLDLVESFVGNMRDGHAKIKMDEVVEHLDQTYFAWVGGTEADSVFYYRVHSPVVLIEFDHQRRVAPFRSREPSRDHIHAVLRTPNGNDYGKDLLGQHIEQHHSP